MNKLIAAAAASVLALGSASQAAAADRVGVQYRLPRTTPVATAKVTLLTCGRNPTFAVDVQFTARADLGPAYVFRGDALSSWRVARDFTLEVDPDGRIAGVNATSTDKTASIITNIFKGVVGLVKTVGGMGVAALPPTEQCTAEAASAVARATTLRAALAKIRATAWDPTQPLANLENQQKQIDAISTELSALETGVLTQEISVDAVTTTPDAPIVFVWPKEAFAKWLTTPRAPEELNDLSLTAEVIRPTTLGTLKKPMKCDLSVAVPRPAFVTFKKGGKAVLQAAVQQWGEVDSLCLDTGLFADRTVEVVYDDFGVMTKMTWKSNARAESASAAFDAAAAQYAAFREANQKTSSTQKASDAADLAEARIRQIKAEQCLARMQAGATCD